MKRSFLDSGNASPRSSLHNSPLAKSCQHTRHTDRTMGAKQSRQVENVNSQGESWQSRVSVQPSEKLVVQLQQQQQQQQDNVGSESPTTLEDHEERDRFRDREEHARRARTRREEVRSVKLCLDRTTESLRQVRGR